jgi:hypothetical protein
MIFHDLIVTPSGKINEGSGEKSRNCSDLGNKIKVEKNSK